MEHALDLDGVLDLLRTGALLLFPSTAAAQDVQGEYGRRQRQLGLHAWEPAPAVAWDIWLDSLWSALAVEGLEPRVLMNRLQEELLWARLATLAGLPEMPFSATRELARQARSTLALAADFRVVDRIEPEADSTDARTFAAWHKIFAAHCRRDDLLPRALLPEALLAHVRASRVPLPDHLHLVGFDRLSPVQSALLKAFRTAGKTVHRHTLRQAAGPGTRAAGVIAGDPEAELRGGLGWMRRYLTRERGPADGRGPGDRAPVRTALILPDPEAERAVLEPLLRAELAPELEAVSADLSSAPWHFSTGPALATLPLIAHPLALLRWLLGELPTESIGTLLLSPYLEHGDDFERRARFDLQILRKVPSLRPEMTLSGFLQWAAAGSRRGRDAGPALSLPEWRQVHALAQRTLRSSATYGEWTESVRRLLRTAGWPGTRLLSPREFRTTEAWDSVLDLLATLDLHGGRVSLPQFMDALAKELALIPLQDTSQGAILHILRPSETEGRLFDAALVLRATDRFWPAPEPTHALLGWALQRRMGMPGTDAAQTQERSRLLLQALADRTKTLLLLSAAHDSSGPLRLTPLAAELDMEVCAPETLHLPPEPTAHPISYDRQVDAEPLPALPSPRIAGGARVLELQANCGFRAFAALRLAADAPELPALGSNPRQAGQDVHKALELLWKDIPDRQALFVLTAAERNSAVAAAVRGALEDHRSARSEPDRWTEAYLTVAEQRLTRLLGRWLEEELRRDDFAVVHQEQKRLVSVGPLELSIRPDRIDSVEGGLVFIDYKTSSALSVEDWRGERPNAPQLPLYALLAPPGEVRGIAFGRVRAGGDMGWISLAAESGLFPPKGGSLSDDFEENLAQWRAELERLATDFAGGVASVDPKAYPHTCEYCQHRLLCRLDPVTLLALSPPESRFSQEEEVQAGR